MLGANAAPSLISDKVLTAFDGALQKAAISSLTERTTKLIEKGLIEVCAISYSEAIERTSSKGHLDAEIIKISS